MIGVRHAAFRAQRQPREHFATISQIQLVYGSLTTAISMLLSVEVGAIVPLLSAQVIAKYERIGYGPMEKRAGEDEGEQGLKLGVTAQRLA